MHGRTLSSGLHQGQQVQMRLAERAQNGVGGKHQHDQKNSGEISPGELRHSGMFNPTQVDISIMLHLGHGRRVSESGENDSGNILASSFLHKDENPLIHRIRIIWSTVRPSSSDGSNHRLLK